MKMKRFYGLCILLFTATANAQVSYHISGVWENGADKMVYLGQEINDNLIMIDSAKVTADYTFILKGKLKGEDKLVLSCTPKSKVEVFINGDPLNAIITEKTSTNKKTQKVSTFYKISVTGGREQSVLEQGNDLATSISFFQLGKMMLAAKAMKSENKSSIDSAKTAIAAIDSLSTVRVKEYMDSTRNDIASTYFFERYLMTNNTFDEVTTFYNSLTDRVKQSAPGKQLEQQLKDMQQVNIGGMAPNFELDTPEGRKLSLYNLRGHIVLLDFWASWCGPCLAEMPNIKAIYQKYHDKGLEILGVSLDEKPTAWKNAIEKKKLNWYQVSSLKGWKCPVAKRFQVTGIPRMYIIDQEGRIIAQDLRGEALAKKMDELFAE